MFSIDSGCTSRLESASEIFFLRSEDDQRHEERATTIPAAVTPAPLTFVLNNLCIFGKFADGAHFFLLTKQ